MAANSKLVSGSIEPGSIPYGERGQLQDNISSVMSGASGGQQGGGGAPAGGGAPPPLPSTGDPMASLLGGAVAGDDLPVTDGLSIGPGAGAPTNDPMLGTKAQKYRSLATEASSPAVRALARQALRKMAGEAV
jgi:hypothetical protein